MWGAPLLLLFLPSSLGICGYIPRYDPVRLLAEQNTPYIAQFLDNSRDVSLNYRTKIFPAGSTNRHGRLGNIFSHIPSSQSASVLFSILLVSHDVNCDATLFEAIRYGRAQMGRRQSNLPRYFFLGVGYQAGSLRSFRRSREARRYHQFKVPRQTFAKDFGGRQPQICLSTQKMTNSTGSSRVQTLTFMFNFVLTSDGLQKRSAGQLSTSGNQECRSSGATLEMVAGMHDTRSQLYSFTQDRFSGTELDGFIGKTVSIKNKN